MNKCNNVFYHGYPPRHCNHPPSTHSLGMAGRLKCGAQVSVITISTAPAPMHSFGMANLLKDDVEVSAITFSTTAAHARRPPVAWRAG